LEKKRQRVKIEDKIRERPNELLQQVKKQDYVNNPT